MCMMEARTTQRRLLESIYPSTSDIKLDAKTAVVVLTSIGLIAGGARSLARSPARNTRRRRRPTK